MRALRSHLTLLAALLAGSACSDSPDRPPDVILVVVDTLRADRLGCYEYPRETSPWIDARAADGSLFRDVTAQSSWTLPSMVSLMSGRYLTRYRDAMDPELPTLAERFQGGGYRTLGLVANVLIAEAGGFARGFDHFDSRRSVRSTPQTVRARDLIELGDALWDPLDVALAEETPGERPPLFLYLHAFDPHAPYTPHAQLDASLPPEGALPIAPESWTRATLAARGPSPPASDPGWENDLRHIDVERGRYDQEVRFADERLRAVFKRLEEAGVLEHAVVALISDHGEGLWEHETQVSPTKAPQTAREFFYQQHGGNLYQEAVATPMLLWGAGVPEGVTIDTPIENVDLYPTLLELAGLPQREELHGQSLVPLLQGETFDPKPTLFSYVLYGAMVREPASGQKLVSPTAVAHELQEREVELYDLEDDPHEREDLVGERPAEAARLFALLESWREEHPTRATFERASDQTEGFADLGYTDEHSGGGDEALLPPR